MIGFLRGRLVSKGPGDVLLDVGGVGYRLSVPTRCLAELPAVGEEVVLHTHLHVREDALALFGFPTRGEREVFESLIGATGVGPRLAVTMLSVLPPDELRRGGGAGRRAPLPPPPRPPPQTAPQPPGWRRGPAGAPG